VTGKARIPISKTAGDVAIAAIAAYQVLLIILILLRPDLDPSWHTISEWAYGRYGWMMSVGFLLSALSYGALFVMLWPHATGALSRIGLVLLAICCIGALGVGACRTDPMPLHSPLTARGAVHVISGTAQLMLLPFAALFTSLGLASRNHEWAPLKRVLLWTCCLPLLGWMLFVGITIAFVVPLGKDAYGPGVYLGWPPRVAFFTYALWVITVAWQGLKLERAAQIANKS
jgi:hypothetical protein